MRLRGGDGSTFLRQIEGGNPETEFNIRVKGESGKQVVLDLPP